MGLLDDVVLFPITGPVKGLLFIFEKIAEQVDKEMNDEGQVQQKLMELEALLEAGEISEEEYEAAETALLERLQAIRERKAAQEEAEGR